MGWWNNHRLRQAGKYAKAHYAYELAKDGRHPNGDIIRTPEETKALEDAWNARIRAKRREHMLPPRPDIRR